MGNKLICIKRGLWRNARTLKVSVGPAHGEVVTLRRINKVGYLVLAEYSDNEAYNPKEFRPYDPLQDLMDRIESEGAHVEKLEPEYA